MTTPDIEQSEYRPFRKLGDRLRQARLRAGYASQPALARVLGMNHNTICRHEGGHVLPAKRILDRYCQVLRIDEAELQYGIGLAPPPGSVIDFLMSRDARELLDETRDRLLRVNWSVFSEGPIAKWQVGTIAQLIDRNLRKRGSSSDVELPRSPQHVSQGARAAHS